jgi:hypothetical protein
MYRIERIAVKRRRYQAPVPARSKIKGAANHGPADVQFGKC